MEEDWTRASVDVVHYKNIPYLSMVDCGPGRFAIWRKMKGESSAEICKEVENIFYERGPLREMLLDNAPAFRSTEVKQLMQKWNVRPIYRAAWRPGGNGIVERHHRTIKAMSERGDKDPIEAVYWYNMSPREGQKEDSVPHLHVHKYEWRIKGYADEVVEEQPECEFKVGDEVWVKPGNARCTTPWQEGTVTQVNSANNVDVDGMARHILDVRTREATIKNDLSSEGEDDNHEMEAELSRNQVEDSQIGLRYPQRIRTSPVWLRDFDRD